LLSFLVYKSKSFNLFKIRFELVNFYRLLVDVFVKAEKHEELLFKTVEKLKYSLAFVKLVHIYFHPLKSSVDC